jgi:hypothetical protein
MRTRPGKTRQSTTQPHFVTSSKNGWLASSPHKVILIQTASDFTLSIHTHTELLYENYRARRSKLRSGQPRWLVTTVDSLGVQPQYWWGVCLAVWRVTSELIEMVQYWNTPMEVSMLEKFSPSAKLWSMEYEHILSKQAAAQEVSKSHLTRCKFDLLPSHSNPNPSDCICIGGNLRTVTAGKCRPSRPLQDGVLSEYPGAQPPSSPRPRRRRCAGSFIAVWRPRRARIHQCLPSESARFVLFSCSPR